MSYSILADALKVNRIAMVDNAFIHLSDGTSVFLAYHADTDRIGLWRSTQGGQPVVITDDTGLRTTYRSGTDFSEVGSLYLLARDNADNLYAYNAQTNKIRAYVKGSGYTWTANAILTPSGAWPMGGPSYSDMTWVATGGGTNGKGHLLVIGFAGDAGWRTIDAGTVLAGTGTPACVLGSGTTGSPFGTYYQRGIGQPGIILSPNVQIAPDGFGAASGVVAGIANDGVNNVYPIPLGSWSVSSNGTPTFTHIGSLGDYEEVAAQVTEQPYRLRVLRLSADRFVVVYQKNSGFYAQTAVVVSKTAVLSASRPLPDTQITNWPYPNGLQEWDVGLDVVRGKMWVYAASRTGPALYRLGATISGTTVTWDNAVTVEDAAFGAISNDANRAQFRLARHRVNSTQDYHASRGITLATTYALQGGASIYNLAPFAPTLTFPAANQYVNVETTNVFTWTFSDPDAGDYQTRYDLRYCPVGSAWIDTTNTTPLTSREFGAGTLATGQQQWEVRTYDATGTVGPYSATGYFVGVLPPTAPTITSPVNGSTLSSPEAVVRWSAPEQDAYQVRRVADSGGSPDPSVIFEDTGTAEFSSVRMYPVAFTVNGRAEHVQVRVRRNGYWSTYASVRVVVNYSPPPTPVVVLSPEVAHIKVTVTNPASTGDQPTVVVNEVYRRKTEEIGQGIRLSRDTPVGGAFRDYSAASDTDYSYRVVGIGVNGTFSSSPWIT